MYDRIFETYYSFDFPFKTPIFLSYQPTPKIDSDDQVKHLFHPIKRLPFMDLGLDQGPWRFNYSEGVVWRITHVRTYRNGREQRGRCKAGGRRGQKGESAEWYNLMKLLNYGSFNDID